MRITFINNLINKRKYNKNIFLVTGDLGYSVMEEFITKFPSNYINAGVAEQNMIGFTAGLSLEGNKVYVYSINNFVVFRALEQIRNDICYHNLKVKIVTVGSGFSYGTAGYTHYGIEDITIVRALPNITIFCPADPIQLSFIFNEINNYKTPLYLRLGKGNEPNITTPNMSKNYLKKNYFEIFQAKKINLICFGSIAIEAYKACLYLREKLNINVGLITIPKITKEKNIYLDNLIKKSSTIITLEEHILIGGFGSYILETYYNRILKVKFYKLGVNKRFNSIGNQQYMRKINNIDCEGILNFIKNKILKK